MIELVDLAIWLVWVICGPCAGLADGAANMPAPFVLSGYPLSLLEDTPWNTCCRIDPSNRPSCLVNIPLYSVHQVFGFFQGDTDLFCSSLALLFGPNPRPGPRNP